MEAERGEALTGALKNSLLFSLLGTEGQHRFGSHPLVARIKDATTTHALFQKAVQDHIRRPTNVAHACLEFQRRFQGPNESATDFLAALREMAPDCEFPDGTLARELVLQVLSGCRSQKACERMLLRPVALDDYTQILETDETVREDSAAFAAATGKSASTSSVQLVSSCQHTQKPSGRQVQTPLGGGPNSHCFACGSRSHFAKSDQCPARNARCRFCHKTGHYELVCQTKWQA